VRGSSDRSFGLLFAGVFTVLALWPLVRGRPVRAWSLVAAAAFLAVALLAPRVLAPLNHWWLRLGLLMHAVISPIVMGLLFFATLTPIALVFRWSGRDPLRLAFAPEASTYWIERRPPGPDPDTMPRQF